MSALNEAFAPGSMLLGVTAGDWRAAIRLAGSGLIASARVEPAYVDAMVESVEVHGPYIVIAPQVALAHAAISPDVHSPGFSLAQLAEPVAFGDQMISLVFALAAQAGKAHAELMAEFSNWLLQPNQVNFLLNAESEEQIRASIAAASAKIAE